MCKLLEAVSLATLAALFLFVGFAFFGPDRLPARIPTHFDAAGNANSWGSPFALLTLPAVALGVYLLLTVTARFPSTFNYPVEVTAENRPRLEALTVDLLAWLKTEIVCLSAAITWVWMQAVRHSGQKFSPLWVLVFAGAVLVTVAGYFWAMFRAAR